MNIWEILELEPTSDSRDIKRAYARKLKTTRPDEQPEAFQALHHAYKTALDYAAYQHYQAQQEQPPVTDESPAENTVQASAHVASAEQSSPAGTGSDNIGTQPQPEVPLAEPESSALPPSAGLSSAEGQAETPGEPSLAEEPNPYQIEGERLVALAQALLNTTSELHMPESWEFLMRSPFILDDQFNWRLGLGILQVIQEHNKRNHNKPLILIGSRVLTYLDSIFNWKLNQHHIYRFFEEEEYAPLLAQISETEPLEQSRQAVEGVRGASSIKMAKPVLQPETLYYASPMKRLAALVIDLVGMFFISSLLLSDLARQTGSDNVNNAVLIIPLVLGFFYFWACECSSTQATLGKLIMGLVVTNKHFERMTPFQGFCRSLVFSITALFTYIALIINAMMGDKLIHDRMTKTYVIDMRRSRQS
ncbi:RDD family protein [Cellvibrio japonicus]|uniref:RDD family domain protein n=1 Tax=Cellvibrio japonicus (strain Ueda107) TaxID=498211 RepID=B3PBV4_CELJU|nr:RDD family protein [Cellvibrio japonicus]ACE85062.1 RDD family domain protein [Cellvibrio japonicus Ueda107]QEI11770.1 hypothetical protein FY117_05680 [Cellvibrio japonicus]QEI15344.1 hypothetical protein FY116_05680 [Cellvibrio japonicus]QEI18924.1 hypothetical protein FY115_05680 [Cellvibrio japonicus]